jgi:hypothetical protein
VAARIRIHRARESSELSISTFWSFAREFSPYATRGPLGAESDLTCDAVLFVGSRCLRGVSTAMIWTAELDRVQRGEPIEFPIEAAPPAGLDDLNAGGSNFGKRPASWLTATGITRSRQLSILVLIGTTERRARIERAWRARIAPQGGGPLSHHWHLVDSAPRTGNAKTDVALFLPFRCNKRRQRAANSSTKRKSRTA